MPDLQIALLLLQVDQAQAQVRSLEVFLVVLLLPRLLVLVPCPLYQVLCRLDLCQVPHQEDDHILGLFRHLDDSLLGKVPLLEPSVLRTLLDLKVLYHLQGSDLVLVQCQVLVPLLI